jgi:predicted 3-demethylubiquinone-9 3-methyltransferase (glyoxalase superfamily)
MQKITAFLWFDGKAEEAVDFYTSLFKNSKVVSITRYGEEFPGVKGKVLTAIFQLDGQEYLAIDGGPQFTITHTTMVVLSKWTKKYECYKELQKKVDKKLDYDNDVYNEGQ